MEQKQIAIIPDTENILVKPDSQVLLALKTYDYQSMTNKQLADFMQFTDKEKQMMKIFWEPCFNHSWIYLPREMIKEWFCGEEKSKHAVNNFYNRTLLKKYEEGIDYKEISEDDPLMEALKFWSSKMKTKKSKDLRGGSTAKHYAVTGECFKMICMEKNRVVRKYFIKVEELAIFMKDCNQALMTHNMQLQQIIYQKQKEQLLLEVAKSQQKEIEYKKESEQKELEFKQKELESKRKETELIEKLEKEKKKNIKLTTFVDRAKRLEKTQIFYIVTTEQLALQNRFKFGGVKRRDLLKSNLGGYNRGVPKEMSHYYAFVIECHNFRHMEARLKDVLPIFFKDDQDTRGELVNCHYTAFIHIVEFLVDNYDKEIELINNYIKTMIEMTLNHEPIVPEPIVIERQATLTITENGEVLQTTTFTSVSDISDEDLANGIKEILQKYALEIHQLEYSYDADKNIKDLNIVWKKLQTYILQYFRIPKNKFRAKQWSEKIKPLLTPQLKIMWRKKEI